MKKILFFIPSLVAIFFYGAVIFAGGIGGLEPIAWGFLALLLLSGLLMAKGSWWGSLFGLVVGLILIYMSFKFTGQLLDEGIIGIIYALYHVICGIVIYRNSKKA